MPAQVEVEKCEGCGDCVDVCSSSSIQVVENRAVVDKDLCIDCNACMDACTKQAITMGD